MDPGTSWYPDLWSLIQGQPVGEVAVARPPDYFGTRRLDLDCFEIVGRLFGALSYHNCALLVFTDQTSGCEGSYAHFVWNLVRKTLKLFHLFILTGSYLVILTGYLVIVTGYLVIMTGYSFFLMRCYLVILTEY